MRPVDLKARAGTLMVGASVLFGGVYFLEVRSIHDQASCQADLNREFIEVLTTRSAPGQTRADAVDSLLLAFGVEVLHPDKDRAAAVERIRPRIREHAAASEAYRKTRDATPYPAFKLCD